MILFLDIDGVLVTWQSMMDYYERKRNNKTLTEDEMFSHDCIEALKYLMQQYNEETKIVISSAWRVKGIKYLRTIFENAGIYNEIIGVTSNHPEGIRGLEILEYITENDLFDENIIIIDDEVVDITKYVEHMSNVKIIHVHYGLERGGLFKEIIDEWLS